MSVNQWGSELGKKVLTKLSLLYTYLVWESSVLLTLCTPNLSDNEKVDFAKEDLKKLIPKDVKPSKGLCFRCQAKHEHLSCLMIGDCASSGMEYSSPPALTKPILKQGFLFYAETIDTATLTADEQVLSTSNKAALPPSRIAQLRLIKWLLTSSSHLGRALAELFGLLVHQCIAPQPRIRRHPVTLHPPGLPSLPARLVAEQLTKVLIQGLSWVCPEDVAIPRLRYGPGYCYLYDAVFCIPISKVFLSFLTIAT